MPVGQPPVRADRPGFTGLDLHVVRVHEVSHAPAVDRMLDRTGPERNYLTKRAVRLSTWRP